MSSSASQRRDPDSGHWASRARGVLVPTLDPSFLTPSHFSWPSFFTINALRIPTHRKLNLKGISPAAARGGCPPPQASSAAAPPATAAGDHQPLGLSTDPRAKPTGLLCVFLPQATFRVRHGQPVSLTVSTRFVTKLLCPFPKVKPNPPKGQGKRMWCKPQKGFRRFPQCVGPWPHYRIKWPLIRSSGP